MNEKSTVFEKTYQGYLDQIKEIDRAVIKERLGVELEKGEISVFLFGRPVKVLAKGIIDPEGKRPGFEICVIISKYLLLCPDGDPDEKEWVSFRGMKDSGPLTAFFLNDVEKAISTRFEGRLKELENACKGMGGYIHEMDTTWDLSIGFNALPKVPLILLFNDADEEFPANCSILFERRAEKYLDAECLAMLGRLLFSRLKEY